MYRQDSFFDLSGWGQIGLLCLSTALFVLIFIIARMLLSRRPLWISICGAMILYWLFVWLSPQVYYMYYRLIIPDLPLQWVIWPPKSPLLAMKFMFFQGPHNLSAHSQGLFGWILLASPFLKLPGWRRNMEN